LTRPLTLPFVFVKGSATRRLSEPTVSRLAVYLRVLLDMTKQRRTTVSSEELAEKIGVNHNTVRRDFWSLGVLGIRGVGYNTDNLILELSQALGLSQERSVVIMGAGNLGSALANYRGFPDRGFRLVAVFDVDPTKIGTHVGGLPVRGVEELATLVRNRDLHIGMIATPAAQAQAAADSLVEGGIHSILNFAPTRISAPADVSVRYIDLSVELQILSFYSSGQPRRNQVKERA
jgi:redox-sensing transcriptional repressor